MIKQTLAAAATAAVAFVTPVQAADADDVAKVLLGAVALGVIADAVSDGRVNGAVTVRGGHHRGHDRHVRRGHGSRVIDGRLVPLPRGHGAAHARHVSLPAGCNRRIRTGQGDRTFLGRPCLTAAGIDTARLPDRCERILRLPRTSVRAWNRGCLLNAGYRIR